MGATSKIWLLGIFCLCIIYLCWLLWIPGEGGMWPWVWSEEMFNQNSSPFCDFLKVFQKMRIFQGFKALLVLFWCFAVSGLSLRAGGCCCSLPELSANPPPVALFVLMLSSSGKRGHLSFEQLMSRPFSEAASWALQWESCEGAVALVLGEKKASELCRCSKVWRHWLCFRPEHCHMDLQKSLNSAVENCSWFGMQVLSKVQICGCPGGSLVLTLGTTEPWQCNLQAPSSLLSPSLYGLGFFPFSMATRTVGFVWLF